MGKSAKNRATARRTASEKAREKWTDSAFPSSRLSSLSERLGQAMAIGGSTLTGRTVFPVLRLGQEILLRICAFLQPRQVYKWVPVNK